MFNFIVLILDVLLYLAKFIAYGLIALYLFLQYRVGEMPQSDAVQTFLDISNKSMLPFLAIAAASEALHIALKPFLKLAEIIEDKI